MGFALQDIFGRQYPLDKLIKIGNDKTNDIVLLDIQVSPFHASVSEQQGNLLLQDLNSSSGTFVNQSRIEGAVSIKSGDSIAIGNAIFKIVDISGGQSATLPPLPPPPEITRPKRKRGCLIAIIVGAIAVIFLCLVVFGAWYYVSSTHPEIIDSINEKLSSSSPQDIDSSKGSSQDSNSPQDTSSPPGVNQEGPKILSLEDTALTKLHTTSFIVHSETITEGVDENGNELVINNPRDVMEQSTPEWSSYYRDVMLINQNIDEETEYSFLNGKSYSKSGTECIVIPDKFINDHTPSTNEVKLAIQNYVGRGNVKKTESGVAINGVLTDKYEVTLENKVSKNNITEFVGELYRAQDGGYLVRYQIVSTWKPESRPEIEKY
ncbi:MAG: FHA domain-containing protein, partial [Leptolinea sp.]